MKPGIFIILLLSSAVSISAQERLNSAFNDYYSYLMLQGLTEKPGILWHSMSNNNWEAPEDSNSHPWGNKIERTSVSEGSGYSLNLTDTEIYLSGNTSWAQGYNDGAMWQGKGINGRLRSGIVFNSKFWQLTFDPEFWFAQNAPFDIVPPSSSQSDPYGYYHDNLDYPQRPGSSAVYKFSFGQSDLRFNYGVFTTGISTENIVLGPAVYNPVILSANAEGFPHFDIGIKKWDSVIGSLEGRYFFGFLHESDNYNTNVADDWRLMTGLSTAYAPSFIPGLSLGINWTIETPGGDFAAKNWFLTFLTMMSLNEDNHTNDNDQRFSVFLDWTFPKVGFEVYGEYGREDFSPGGKFFIAPEHTGFWVLGARQAIPINSKRGFLVTGEMSSLMVSRTQNLIWDTDYLRNYYTHHKVYHGYTNNGQILGAGIGPGSDAQVLKIDYYDTWGKAYLEFQRRSIDKAHVYSYEKTNTVDNLNVEFIFGGGGMLFVGKWNLDMYMAGTYKWNHNYIPDNNRWNMFASINAGYRY